MPEIRPILISVAGVQDELMVGVYYGYKKLDDINLFLEEFVNGVIYLINNGFEINGRLLRVRLKCISANTYAKFFLFLQKVFTLKIKKRMRGSDFSPFSVNEDADSAPRERKGNRTAVVTALNGKR
jgi:hypothetical protein